MTTSGGERTIRGWRAVISHRVATWQATARLHHLCVFALGVVALGALALAACGQVAPVPTPPRPTPPPDVQIFAGQARYTAVGCAACHGANGEGAIGPRLSGITTPLPEVIAMLRTDIPHGIKFEDDELTNQDIINIYLWLRTNPAG